MISGKKSIISALGVLSPRPKRELTLLNLKGGDHHEDD